MPRFIVRGFYYPNNYREYQDIDYFDTYEDAQECLECQLDDDRVTAMFDRIVIRQVY